LPRNSTIRIWAAISLGANFNAQRAAEFRRYNYLMPLSILGGSPLQIIRDQIMPQFCGEHRFHNYTRRVSASSGAAKRTISTFAMSDAFRVNGREFVLVTIRGNSFMLNQIRKMIAVVVLVAIGRFPLADLPATFGDAPVSLPRFPGEGLFLDQIEYPAFMRVSNATGRFTGDAKDVEFTARRPEIEEWKRTVLLPHIADLVTREQTFERWLESLEANRSP
jgi:tRNA pseudouridine38-40 synthase